VAVGGREGGGSGRGGGGGDPSPSANLITTPPASSAIADAPPHEIAKLVARSAQIPRSALDEAVSVAGPSFSADPYLAQEAVSDTAGPAPVVGGIPAANPEPGEGVRQRHDGAPGVFVGPGVDEDAGN